MAAIGAVAPARLHESHLSVFGRDLSNLNKQAAMNPSILVTGGTGYNGSHAVVELIVLLAGGDKSTQDSDVKRAIAIAKKWRD